MSLQSIIAAYSRQYGIDPRAALAVARVEGGFSGAVGDQGTSFGPFQLHVGGALPAGKGAAWASSPAGIEYAIRRMSQSGARGLQGGAAINAIVRNFERPAAPGAEVQRALGLYGSGGGSVPTGRLPSPGSGGGHAPGPGGGPSSAMQALLNFASGQAQAAAAPGQNPMQAGPQNPGGIYNPLQQPGQVNPFEAMTAMSSAAQGDATHAPAHMPGSAGGAGPVSGKWGAPLPSMVMTSGYGPRVGVVSGEKFHYGVDLSAPAGTPIHPLQGGKVIFAGMYGSGGNTVIIKDAQGREWFYHHMIRTPAVHVGQTIGLHTLLGNVGSTGASTGNHLHIGLQVGGRWTDPTRFIKRAFRR